MGVSHVSFWFKRTNDSNDYVLSGAVIWDALKAVCETIELEDRYVIIESAGIIVAEEVRYIADLFDILHAEWRS